MEHMQRNLPVCHALNKAGRGCLIIIGGKGCGQPQTKGPCRRQCRFSGQFGIFFYCSHRSFSTDHIVIQPFPFYRKLHPFYFLAGNLIRYVTFVVNQNTISFIGHIERNIFISDLTGRTAVLVPHLHDLSVFHKWCETLAKAIHIFIHIQQQLIQHIVLSGLCILHISQVTEAGLCQEGISLIKCHLIAVRCFVDHSLQRTCLIDQLIFGLLDTGIGCSCINLCKWTIVYGAIMMNNRYFDHSVHRTG